MKTIQKALFLLFFAFLTLIDPFPLCADVSIVEIIKNQANDKEDKCAPCNNIYGLGTWDGPDNREDCAPRFNSYPYYYYYPYYNSYHPYYNQYPYYYYNYSFPDYYGY